MNANKWLFFIAGRFNRADSRGRTAMTTLFSVLGIAFGTTSLIVILSVMNGFQMGYIESILEVSSYHVRLELSEESIQSIRNIDGVRSVVPFREIQGLVQGRYERQSGILLRSLPNDVCERDPGFNKTVSILEGQFDISQEKTVVLGSELARSLSVSVGDTILLGAVAGDASTDIFSDSELTVTGIFATGYYEIDTSFGFISQKTGTILAGEGVGRTILGVKLDDPERDSHFLSNVAYQFPNAETESWRTYNRAFFGALRVEKNMMLFLVILIFVVVTVNIYNAMRRSVYERREEISVLSALGAHARHIRYIFIANGFGIGLAGGLIGLLCGLLLAVRINSIFSLAENIVNGLSLFIAGLIGASEGESFALFSPEFFYMNEIPVRIFFGEVFFVFLFGVLSAASASWFASRTITRLKPAEVLRYE